MDGTIVVTNSGDEHIHIRLGKAGLFFSGNSPGLLIHPFSRKYCKCIIESMVAEIDSYFTDALSPSHLKLGLNNHYHHMVAIKG